MPNHYLPLDHIVLRILYIWSIYFPMVEVFHLHPIGSILSSQKTLTEGQVSSAAKVVFDLPAFYLLSLKERT